LRSIPITNLPEEIYRPWVYRFVFLQHKLDGSLIGVVEVYSRCEKRFSDATYYYSVLLDQTECRVSKLIRQFDENKNDCVHLNSQFQVVYRRHRTDVYIFSIYEVFVSNHTPTLKEIVTFDYPDLLCGMVANGNYVIAYSHPHAKERDSIYVRNLTTCESNFVERPKNIRRNCSFKYVRYIFSNNICNIAGRSRRDSQIYLSC
jgi:hypothetical protein